MRKLKGLLANLLAIAIVLGVPGHIALKVEEQLGFISELIPHVHTHEDTGGLSDWLTPGVVIAHAAGSVQDGDNQYQQAGGDANSDNYVDNGAFGCWRLWLGTKENGTPVSRTTDCGPMSPPSDMTNPMIGENTKLQARGGSISSAPGKYDFKYVPEVPALGTSIGGLKAFWEQDDYRAFKNCMADTGWSESDLEKYKAGEYVIVMEPVGWVKFSGVWFALSSTELAALNQGMGNLLRERMGTFTHGELPGYAWLETNDWQAGWGIPAGTGFSGLLSDATSMSTYGISIVYTVDNMCCNHDATNCGCYQNATPPNTDPTSEPKRCKCFETHLSDPNNPIPCGPGVPDCDCYPPQCCEHSSDCPCGPGQHPGNNPDCECPDTHPGVPCGPDVEECDCFEHEADSDLIIHEDELTQTMGAEMMAKGVKFQVTRMPEFEPSSAAGINNIASCQGNLCPGHGSGDDAYYCGRHSCGHINGSWTNHSFSSSMVYGNSAVKFNREVYMRRDKMQVNQPIDQYKITGLIGGDLDIKYNNDQISKTHTGNQSGGPTTSGPFDTTNILYFIGHRQGVNRQPIPIAAYMGATSYNMQYKDWINLRINHKDKYPCIPGYQFMEGFDGLTDAGAGSYNFTVKYNGGLHNSTTSNPYTAKVVIDGTKSETISATMSFSTPNSSRSSSGQGCTLGLTNSWTYPTCCSGMSAAASVYNGNFPESVSIPQVDYTWTVKVEGTVVSAPKSNDPLQQKESFEIQYNRDDVYLIQSPIPTWSFYPTFKMTADYTPGVQGNKPVWVLAAGQRDFNAYDALRIEHKSADVAMTAPWSRDYEDKQQAVNVAKAGMAYKASSRRDVIQVDAWVTVIDPNYVHPDNRDSIISDNERRINEYATAIETIIAAPESNWGMYTNLRQGSSQEAAYVVPFVSTDKDQSEKVKTMMRRTLRGYGHGSLSWEAYRTDGNVAGRDGVVQRSYSARGFTYTDSNVGMPASYDTMTKAQTNLKELLQDGPSWYNEDYEGIIVVHISGQAYLSGGAQSEYTSIYRHESDWQTPFNANSKALVNQYAQKFKIPQGKYGVGIDFKVPTFSVGGKSVSGLNVGSRIYEFGVRGNVFDDT